tara:strand:+ start:735 stop:1106 length:372 start_codon:yes stop_codon:yes gene_type:complete
MAIKLDKLQRQDKKNLELETGHTFTAREYLINTGKLKDEWGNRDTSNFFSGNAHKVGIGDNTTSTVNAFAKYAQQMGQKNHRNQLARGRYNKKRPVETWNDDFYKMPESNYKYKSGKGFKVKF